MCQETSVLMPAAAVLDDVDLAHFEWSYWCGSGRRRLVAMGRNNHL